MTATSRDETTKRLNRLAGSGRGSGGGLPLPDLFSAMLNEVLDSAPVSTQRMTELASSVLGFKEQAVFATWPSWEAFTADVLAQMESRKVVIQREDGSWVKGPKLVTGQRIEIIPARPDVGSKSDGVTVWPKDERAERSHTVHVERDATSLIANPRPVNRNHVQEIRESLQVVGQLYPVLTDKHGRLLDGRHRRAADPNWPAEPARRADGAVISTEAEALAVIRATGIGAPLPSATVKDIDRLLGEMAKSSQIKRDRIKDALLEDASQSNRQIAELIGVGHPLVAEVREELMEESSINRIHRYEFPKGGHSRTGRHSAACWCGEGDAEPTPPRQPSPAEVKVEDLLRENPQQSDRQVLAAAGLTENHHKVAARVRDRLEVSGAIPVVTAREGSDGTVRHLPRLPESPPPSAKMQPPLAPSPPAKIDSAESAWPRIVGRIERFASRWRDTPPDRDSALKELEDLRHKIDEEIEALRR